MLPTPGANLPTPGAKLTLGPTSGKISQGAARPQKGKGKVPRIYDEDRNPLDYCQRCFQSVVLEARQNQDNEIEADHPPYLEDTDYKCDICHGRLVQADD